MLLPAKLKSSSSPNVPVFEKVWIKFYKVDESGEQKDGEAIKTYELSEDTKKIPVPLNKELARKAKSKGKANGSD